PNDPAHRFRLGTLQMRFGRFLWGDRRRPQEVEKLYQEAISGRRLLVKDFPHTPLYRAGLAEALHCLAILQNQTGRPEEAAAPHPEIIALREGLVAEVPDRPAYKRVLAMACGDWGRVLTALGRLEKAEEVLRRSIGLHEELAERFGLDHPTLAGRENLANAY